MDKITYLSEEMRKLAQETGATFAEFVQALAQLSDLEKRPESKTYDVSSTGHIIDQFGEEQEMSPQAKKIRDALEKQKSEVELAYEWATQISEAIQNFGMAQGKYSSTVLKNSNENPERGNRAKMGMVDDYSGI